jgi:hypothetical protein
VAIKAMCPKTLCANGDGRKLCFTFYKQWKMIMEVHMVTTSGKKGAFKWFYLK